MNTSIKKLDDGRQTESMTSLFLSQSYQDAWDDYARSLKKEGFARWDYIVLTASNEEQAEGFHAQIALRQKEKLLPSQTRFLILPDPDGKRVGSGGATLNVLRAIAEAEGTGDFTGKKILVIHSGGDSKRVPQYSAMGKLFSPVPHELPDGRTSTLFDEFMAEMSGVAGRIREGMVLLLSYIDIHGETIPDEIVLHGLKQRDGCFVVRIYGIHDNPKTALSENGCAFLTGTLRQFMDRNGISENELWDEGENKTLWTARLYPVCSTIPEAVAAALNIYEMVNGNGDAAAWKNSERKSLCSGFGEASPHALIDWQSRMHELVKMDSLEQIIHTGGTVQEVRNLLQKDSLSKIQNEWLDRHIGRGGFSSMIRLYYYIGCALGGPEGEKYIDKCFQTIGEKILAGTLDSIQTNFDCRIQCEEHHVNLPLRVNWGGGWSDTPPYCNENGGTVLNAAISLNGDLPVKVTLRRLKEHKIVFDSRDMDTHGEFTEIEPLQSCGDPYDSFALQKAALLVCGIIPAEGSSLEEVLERIGGGIFMSTEVVGVPKGSGLGTSSILAGACVKALFEFTGITYTQEDLYDHVLCMEQLMSTGGGWQDQVGGLSMGLKYITAESGMHQYPKVQQIELKQETKDELNSRFALIYTGQRRLARNLLRDVVGRYIGNEPDALYALSEIQRTAALMRFELERGNVDGFAKLLSEHWELSKKLDKGSTNTCIDQIFAVIEDLIDGKMICGAGGGGFLQVILKKDATKEMLEERLNNVFQDSGVNVWESEILW